MKKSISYKINCVYLYCLLKDKKSRSKYLVLRSGAPKAPRLLSRKPL